MGSWRRIIRGAIGTGLTFAVGAGAIATAVGLAAVVFGNARLDDVRFAGRIAVAAFILGIGFSAFLAVVARSTRLAKLSILKVASLGAAAGLVYFGLISINGIGVWSLDTAIVNFVLLTGIGSGAATATLLLARRSKAQFEQTELESSEEVSLGEDAHAAALDAGMPSSTNAVRTSAPSLSRRE